MQRVGIVACAAAFVVAGCGGGGSGRMDGGPGGDGGGGTDGDPGLCTEFDAPLLVNEYPAVVDDTLAGAGAEHEVAGGSCSVEDAPFGVEVPGPDKVVELDDLTPGEEYAVRLFSTDDLAFYVIGGCAASGPQSCLLYVDATTDSPELGVFTAPDDGHAYVVVDYFLPSEPQEAGFSLEVYPAECEDNDSCSGDTGHCVDRRCVECASSFDCTETAKPVCDARENNCRPGGDQCTGDDPSPPEGGDDGPAGALDVTPAVGESTTTSAGICNDPAEELDYYSFTVGSDGESYTVTLDWDDADVDLDLLILGADGELYGASFWERPEQAALTYLPAGTYYVSIDSFGPVSAPAVPYSLEVSRAGGPGCTAVSDCAAVYANQVFRGQCTGGACRFIEGAGALADGALCDSGDDCDSGLCTDYLFNADADTRSLCTHACDTTADCADLGDEFSCTDYLVENVCVQPCTTDEHCPPLLGAEPATPPWEYLTCETATGTCAL